MTDTHRSVPLPTSLIRLKCENREAGKQAWVSAIKTVRCLEQEQFSHVAFIIVTAATSCHTND